MYVHVAVGGSGAHTCEQEQGDLEGGRHNGDEAEEAGRTTIK